MFFLLFVCLQKSTVDVIVACQPSKLDDRERNPDGAYTFFAKKNENMKQGNLDKFFNIKHKRPVPEFFTLTESFTCILAKDTNAQFVKHCNIRLYNSNFEVTLYCHPIFLKPFQLSNECIFSEKAVYFLKSLLQKAIRRGFTEHALYAAYTLLQLDPIVLYRRLPIIMMEDVCIHDSFQSLVWHMMAEIKPSECFVKYILGVVAFLCDHKTAISYAKHTSLTPKIPDIPIVWAIVFRIQYGGMKGDVEMMNYIANAIISNQMETVQTEIQLYNDNVNTPTVWMFEAIDFHVLPSILCLPLNVPQDELKKMMWINSSCINYRKQNTPYKLEEWKKICHTIREKQMLYFETLKK